MTIEEAARFDSHGLWLCKTARFSKRGTLKNTVLHFVQTSREGMTHQELVTLLAVRVHDTLLDLVKEGGIRRQRLGPTFVYLSGKQSVEKKQIPSPDYSCRWRGSVQVVLRQVVRAILPRAPRKSAGTR